MTTIASGEFVKAFFIKEKDFKGGTSSTGQLVVDFNPENYTLSRNVDFKERIGIGQAAEIGKMQFMKGNFYELKLNLMFDTSKEQSDVRVKVKELRNFMDNDNENNVPEQVVFAWGNFAFTGYIQNMTENYVMFSSNGYPLRVKIDLSLKGNLRGKETSNSTAKETKKVSQRMETSELWEIAYKQYGTPSEWETIARNNDIANPRTAKNKNLKI